MSSQLAALHRYFLAVLALVNIFRLYKVIYGFVPGAYRGIVVIVLPVWRLAAKQFMVRSTREMEDFMPGIVAITVDFFSALFVSTVMSTTGPMYLSVLFIAADLIQSLLEHREVRMNANTVFELLQDLKKGSSRCGSLMENAGTPNLAAFTLAVARDPNAFHISSLEGVRLCACYPHPLTREQANKLQALQTYVYIPGTFAIKADTTSTHINHTAKIAPTAFTPDTNQEADQGPSAVFIPNPKPSPDVPLRILDFGRRDKQWSPLYPSFLAALAPRVHKRLENTLGLTLQLRGRAELGHRALLHHQDAVRIQNRVNAVRNRQRGAVTELLADALLDLAVRLRVDRRRGLVHQNYLRPLQQRTRNRQQLPLAHTEVRALLIHNVVQRRDRLL
ncbi:hypothetical protein ON010_g8967 [Phytophthora cinnamomi]|nr:hypothetical protein ON010_g8967 [Phytophthora cinnamomi]